MEGRVRTPNLLQRYLNLSHELKNRRGEGGAHAQLGSITSESGKYEDSSRHFYRAMKIGTEIGDMKL